jgi:hypothetical protein
MVKRKLRAQIQPNAQIINDYAKQNKPKHLMIQEVNISINFLLFPPHFIVSRQASGIVNKACSRLNTVDIGRQSLI